MTNQLSPEFIEAEARLVRAELFASGAIVRARLSPSALADDARVRLREASAKSFETFSKHSRDIGLVLTGGSIAIALMKAFGIGRSHSHEKPVAANVASTESNLAETASSPTMTSRLRAAVVSCLGAILGLGVSQLVPHSSVESELLGEVRTALGQQVENFLSDHSDGLKRTMAHSFGLSRFAAGLLVLLAMAGDRTRTNPS